jgi:hypothetical protein
MALTKEDISIQGTGGYGTLSYTPEPGENIEGTAGDIAAETATSGIVSSDASAELAGQAPNIVVPVNQSSDSDSEGLTIAPGTGVTSQIDLNDISDKPLLTVGLRAGLASMFPFLTPFLAADTAYQYTQDRAEEKKELERQAQLGLQSSLDDTDPEDVGFTSVADQEFAETGDYDVYSDTPTGPVGAQFGDPTYADPGVDAEENQPTYTAPAPAVDYGYDANVGYQDSGSDSDDSSSGGTTGEGYGGGYGSDYGFAVGGIVRLRKNKQNSRIHDRRKRLAMGGIASLYG